jgi:cation diffusion facilitator family transporter
MSAAHVHAGECAHDADAATRRERRTRQVTVIAFVTMVAEIAVGTWSGSLALLADGWHMATHVGAMGLASLAYWYARRAGRAGRFAFGPGKVATVAGFTNALALGFVALLMAVESVERLASPRPVQFTEAIPVAIVGLVVNLVSAWLLGAEHTDDHHDHNLRSAYVHVLADILTSVLAIAALAVGYFTGLLRLDAVVGIVGAVVILWWAVGLVRHAVPELLDVRLDSAPLLALLRDRLSADGPTTVTDVRLWPLGSGRRGCHLCLVTSAPRPLEEYRRLVVELGSIDHVAIEVTRAEADALRPAPPPEASGYPAVAVRSQVSQRP